MRTRMSIAVFAAALALLLGTGGLYAYDASRDDLIAEGVRVGGIEVGGLRAHEARVKLEREVLEPLSRPVTVRHGARSFVLTPEEAGVGVDIEGSVAAALQRSRDGNLISRSVRAIGGKRERAELEVRVTHDRGAVERLVERVRRAVDRDARNAELDLSGGRVATTPAREGRALRANPLRRQVTAALTSFTAGRIVRARSRVVEPEISNGELTERYPAIVIVNRGAFRLTLYKNLKPAKSYRIAVGQAGMDTPAGEYRIQNKAENPVWHVPDSEWAGELAGKVIPPDDPRNPIEARWMGIYNGAGIHGTEAVSSLGTRASHGCIRMAIPDVIELYDQVPVQSPVYII